MNITIATNKLALCALALCAGLCHAQNTLKIDAKAELHEMPQTFYGVFFEDINYAADGGLYAELIQNRSFEYDPEEVLREIGGSDVNQHIDALMRAACRHTPLYAWTEHSRSLISVRNKNPLNKNNPRYLSMQNRGHEGDFALKNHGYDGIPLKAGAIYDFSFFANRTKPETAKPFTIELESPKGEVLASAEIRGVGKNWKKFEAVLKPSKDSPNARLVIRTSGKDTVNLDMVSLMPRDTFMGRKNGLRKDLAQAIKDLNPKFVRFPGGCLVHGRTINNAYRWEDTVGDLEQRKQKWNRWGYYQSYGLGYYEYFLFCEDLDAEPVPCLPMGVTPDAKPDKQNIVALEDMQEWVDSCLNLIEFANGSAETKWGALRAKMGHPAPFNLKYVGIGNEEGIGKDMQERHILIQDAIRKKYPDIKVIGSLGPGSDNLTWYKFINSTGSDLGDEHYYRPPEWFFENTRRFDEFPKGNTKIFIGEYASHANALINAIAEAAYLTGAERNADFVKMTCYAPLLARYGNIQWGADLIFFDNTNVVKTPNYYMLKMFGNNRGDCYVKNELLKANDGERIFASVTKDRNSNELILKLVNGENEAQKLKLKLESAKFADKVAKGEILTGNPKDLNDRNKERVAARKIEVDLTHDLELPANSVQVLRLKLAK